MKLMAANTNATFLYSLVLSMTVLEQMTPIIPKAKHNKVKIEI